MRGALLLLAVLVLFMGAGAIPMAGDAQGVIFRTPVFIGLLIGLAVMLLACCIRTRWNARYIAFQLCHLGVLLILAGALMRVLWAKDVRAVVPVTPMHVISSVPVSEDERIDPGFGLTVRSFAVDYYPAEPEGAAGSGHRTPRRYLAELTITDAAGARRDCTLAVNHPVRQAGWWIYLMSHDAEGNRYVVLRLKQDPGRGVVIGGIWALMIGTAWLCWRKVGDRA